MARVPGAIIGCSANALTFGIAMALTGCATAAQQADSNAVVVVGYLEKQGYEPIDEYAMSGIFTAKMRVKEVLAGRLSSRTITIQYVSHSGYQDRKRVRLKLRRRTDGIYVQCSVREGAELTSAGFNCPAGEGLVPIV